MGIKIIDFLINIFTKIHKFSKRRLTALYELKYFTDFEDRKDDIYIVTYPKSGTTWMQMIVFILLNNKKPDFEHIYDVSPWLSNEAFKRNSCERVNKLPSPRFFKSHDRYEKFTSGFNGKIIYVYRNVLDLAVSYYYHKKHYNNPKIEIQELIDESFSVEKEFNWFTFHQKWLTNKNKYPIHYVSYESLQNNFEVEVKRLAKFLNVNITEDIILNTKKYASFEYMKANETKFGEKQEEQPQMVFNQFIRKGKAGEGKLELTDAQKDFLLKNYEKVISPILSK